jgi:hypothetical protein
MPGAGKATLLPRKVTAFASQGVTFPGKVTLLAGKVTEMARFGRGPCQTCQHPPLWALLALLALLLPAPLAAKDSLGVFGEWGAFRDPEVPRCYAIAAAQEARPGRALRPSSGQAYASVGTWPKRQVRGQVHVRLSRATAPSAAISLSIGGQRFELAGGGGDAWAQGRTMDAAIVAAMRSAGSMSVSARDASGNRFTDRYSLEGAATAMDAATVGCARVR